MVATGQNKIHTKCDRTYHAELGLIRDFCQSKKISDLSEYTLYSSCEPCAMCAAAMVWSRLGRLVYSVSNKALGEVDSKGINISCRQVFDQSIHKPEILGGILEKDGEVDTRQTSYLCSYQDIGQTLSLYVQLHFL